MVEDDRAGTGAQGRGAEQHQHPKRAKRGEAEADDDAMAVDDSPGVPSTGGKGAAAGGGGGRGKEDALGKWRRELQAHLARAEALPAAPDLTTFLDKPMEYNPRSSSLQGTVDGENNTALILAIKHTAEKAFFVLAHGKDQAYINAQNSKGVTALNIASHRGYARLVRELLERCKADVNIPNTSGSTSLIQASHFGHAEVVRLLLVHGANVDLPNHKGTTALMRAAQEGHREVVEALLGHGGDVNKRNHERMNALMLASQRGHDAIVKMLIKHGADIDCQTVQGSTALMLACKRQHEAVVRALLTAGAEIFIRDSRSRTARDTALKRNNKNIIDMLQAPAQVRLMQAEVRVQRSHLLMKLYELCAVKRAHPLGLVTPAAGGSSTISSSGSSSMGEVNPGVGGDPLTGEQRRQLALARAFDLPVPLFRLVVSFVPWPRMWEAQLPLLHKRCTVDANEALRGALGIMDEVLTDLCVSEAREQSMHLVRLARDPVLAKRVCADPALGVRMPPELLESVLRWNDAQSLLGRYEKGVSFTNLIADRAVKDAARLYSWYRFGGEAEDAGGLREGGEDDGLVAAEGMLEDDGTGGDIGNDEDEEDEDNAQPPPGAGAVEDVAVQMPPPPQPPLQPPPQYQQQPHPAGAPALNAQAQAMFAQVQQNQMQLPAPQPMAVVGAPEQQQQQQQQQHAGDETGSSDNEG